MNAQTSVDAEPAANRLARQPGVRRVPQRGIDLFVVADFLPADTCAELCRLIEAKRRPSTLANHHGGDAYRTSDTCELDPGDPLVARVDEAICLLLGIDSQHGEPIQGQRYDVGQEFREHTDTFNPGSLDYLVHCAEQGQRTWTAMIYLNDVDAGGATRFRKINKTFQPARGTLLTWNNLRPDGQPNELTLHQGTKVRAGVKYIITKWFRQRPLPGLIG